MSRVNVAVVWRRFVPAAVLVAAAVSSGCSARDSRLAGRFVRPGEPAYTIEAEATTRPKAELQDYMRKVRALQAQRKTKTTLLPTIEANNPALSRALLGVALHGDAESHLRVARAYVEAGVPDFAFRHYQRAVAVDGCHAAAYDGLARLWRDWKMPEQAMGEAYRGLRCAPDSAPLYNTLGTIMQSVGQLANARQAYAKALALAPAAAYALNNLCYVELADGSPQSAIAYCRAAVKASPTLMAAYNNLAMALTLTGDVVGASQVLSDGTDPTTSYNSGVLHWVRGEFAEAAEAFDSAADAAPSFGLARKRAVQARRALLDEARAVESPARSGGVAERTASGGQR